MKEKTLPEIDKTGLSIGKVYSSLLQKRGEEKEAKAERKRIEREERKGAKKKKKKKGKYNYKNCIDDDSNFDIFPEPPYQVVPPPSPADFYFSKLQNEQTSIREGNNVPDNLLLPYTNGGTHFGKRKGVREDKYVGKPQNLDGHVLVIGIPGSGKTTGIVLPTLVRWKDHIVAIDPKGDLSRECKRKGLPFRLFNPYLKNSCTYDPFSLLRSDGDDKLAHNAKALALDLITISPKSKDPVWTKAAQNFLAGVIAYHVYQGSTFSDTMRDLQGSTVKELVTKINGSEWEAARIFINKLTDLDDKTLAGTGMDLIDLAILAADPHIRSALGGERKINVRDLADLALSGEDSHIGSDLCNEENNIIDWNYLNTATTPIITILQIPEADLEVIQPLIKLLLNQLIHTLMGRDDKFTTDGEKLPQVLIMLDEFPCLGKIESIEAGLRTLRNRGVTFCIIVQSLPQLDKIYGVEDRRIIFDNCPYKVIFKVTEPESMEYCSRLIGSLRVAKPSFSTTYKSSTDEATNYSLQINEDREPIIFPQEFATHKDIVLMTPEGYCRIDIAPYFEDIEDSKKKIVTARLITNLDEIKDLPVVTARYVYG